MKQIIYSSPAWLSLADNCLGDTVRSQRDYDSHENTSFHRAVIQGWGGCSWLLSFLLFFVCFTFVVVVVVLFF